MNNGEDQRLPVPVETSDLDRSGVQDRILRSVDPNDYKIDIRKFMT